MYTASDDHQRPRRQRPGPLDFVIAPLEGFTPDTLAATWHGGRLRLDEGRVGAFGGKDVELLGWVESDVLLEHLRSGGTAYFRPSGAYDERMMFCTLLE